MSKQAYKFKLYPTRKQRERLQETLDACRALYNAALTERCDAYNFHVRQHPNYYDAATRSERSREVGITYYSQATQLPEIKNIREEYTDVHSQVLQDVLRRVQKAFDAFFRRVRHGEEPGYPRFQGKGRYDSFTYPQAGFSLTHDHRVCLSKIGSIKVKLHREIKGTIKTCLPNGAAAKGGLNKSIVDAGWGMFQQFCVYKAANAGRAVLFVNPRYTSQICSGCGTIVKKELSERWHSCECGCSLDRDHNAAINILRLGRSLQGTLRSPVL